MIGGFKESERIVSDALDAHVGKGTLLLADRGLWGLARWHRLRKALICCGASSGRKARRVQDVPPDGSYLARIEANKHRLRRARHQLPRRAPVDRAVGRVAAGTRRPA
ncbi:hypothetical protein ACFRU3_48310 [Streptomyces sp. NPDC056910]|uniref:hypothetical protein n=1 Tax=Streptomyces sp. NPDC056910 TaxID=3345964 RepID=UPI0036BD6B29